MTDPAAITTQQFWVFLQVLARVSAMVAVAPVFGAAQVPNQVKTGLALIVSLALTPAVAPTLSGAGLPATLSPLVSALILNAVIGLMLGFTVTLTLDAVRVAGAILDLQVGFTLGETFNPAINDLAAPITQLKYMYCLVLFLLANGHHLLLSALTQSFRMLPAAQLAAPGGAFLTYVTDLTFRTLLNGVKIAAPAGAILLTIELTTAYLSRAVPQGNIYFMGMPVKAVVGISLIGAVLPATALIVGQIIGHAPYDLADLLRVLKAR